ncbi:unnamed protein product [Caenorhabditis angaria]|uniref:DNA primase n=1 Tax=Caenorhabditis angaria TaxID=860376 RepID=A0A9P1IJA1_9PELO|nr:unnamed protein product [Caenorhabditis angaria]
MASQGIYNTSRFDFDLQAYYKSYFPFKPFVKWMQYGKKPSEYFCRREFAFILADDVHLRYKSFKDVLAFQKALCSTNPHKLDLGAIYNYMPSENKKHSDFSAVERELVFDIDLTDYDTVRTCCQDAKVCPKCWKFVVMAVKILDNLLSEMFDFKARMWVFSGRRGVHCWIGDEKARKLNNSGRAAIATFLNRFKKDNTFEVTDNRRKMTCVPPVVKRSYKTAMEGTIFEEMLQDQKWLETSAPLFEFPYMSEWTKSIMQENQEAYNTPQERWNLIRKIFDPETREKLEEQGEKVPKPAQGRDRYFMKYFVLKRVYPRLDVNVSTGTNHLLKSPFCVHPKTGNIAVPLDVETIEQFDVENCPRIDHVINESRMETNQDDQENHQILAYKHGILAPYVKNFEKFVELAIVS